MMLDDSPLTLDDLPLDLVLRCIAVLPIRESTGCRSASRHFCHLSGARLARCRAKLGVRELRLLGVVAADPRRPAGRRGIAGAPVEAARVTMELDPQATSAVKDLLRIQGPELAAVIDGVDRAAASLESNVSAAHQSETANAAGGQATQGDGCAKHAGGVCNRQRSILDAWDSTGCMSEAEAYAVLDGQLYVVGPPHMWRWMMQMQDATGSFAQMQNARLYVAGVNAELAVTSSNARDVSNAYARAGGTSGIPGVCKEVHAAVANRVRGKLLFCALEL